MNAKTASKTTTATTAAAAKKVTKAAAKPAVKSATKSAKPSHALSDVGPKGWYWTEAQYLKPMNKVLIDGHRYGVVTVKPSKAGIVVKFSDGESVTFAKDDSIRVNVRDWKGEAAA